MLVCSLWINSRLDSQSKFQMFTLHTGLCKFVKTLGPRTTHPPKKELSSVSGSSYVIVDHYAFAISFAVALHEKPGSLRNLFLLSLRHFVGPSLAGSRARPSLHSSSLVSQRGNHG